jgi:uncharacterized protein (TIRG00374 family)
MIKSRKKEIVALIRIIFGVGIASALLYAVVENTGANVWTSINNSKKEFLIFSILIYGFSLYLTVERLKILLAVNNIFTTMWTLIRISMIGNFFSLILPGAVSGDLIKFVYLARLEKCKKIETAITIFVDRLIGMVGLAIVTIIILIFFLLMHELELKQAYIKFAIWGVVIISILGFLMVFFVSLQSNGNKKTTVFFERIKKIFPSKIKKTIEKILKAFNLFRKDSFAILKAALISISIHILLGVSLFLTARSVGENILKFGSYIFATALGNLISIIPITPGGIGIRDVGLSIILKNFGAVNEIAGVVPVVMTFIIILFRFIGCGFFVLFNLDGKDIKENLIPSDR